MTSFRSLAPKIPSIAFIIRLFQAFLHFRALFSAAVTIGASPFRWISSRLMQAQCRASLEYSLLQPVMGVWIAFYVQSER
jgi:hypothetical protein